jgi:hypothetical protein
VSIAEMGTRDVLREGCGVWIAEEKVEDFSSKVIAMLGNEPARIQLGEAGHDYAQGWSAEKLAQRMLTFYESVIAHQKIEQPALHQQPLENA